MIKINLLENSKGKGKRGGGGGPSMPTMEMGDMGSPKLKVLAVLVIFGLANLMYWYHLDRQSKAIEVRMQAAEKHNRELADVKAQFLERQTQANNYKRRVDVIDGLRQNQTGPVNLLAMLGETVNGTEAVWLSKMDDTGASGQPGRHGVKCRRSRELDCQSAEDRVLQDGRGEGNVPGRPD